MSTTDHDAAWSAQPVDSATRPCCGGIGGHAHNCTAAFVYVWHQQLRCELTTGTGDPCRLPATWRINVHGCEHALVCGRHRKSWIRKETANVWAGLAPRCAHCGRTFASLDDACTVSPL